MSKRKIAVVVSLAIAVVWAVAVSVSLQKSLSGLSDFHGGDSAEVPRNAAASDTVGSPASNSRTSRFENTDEDEASSVIRDLSDPDSSVSTAQPPLADFRTVSLSTAAGNRERASPRANRFGSPEPIDEEPEAGSGERPLGWCFFTTLGHDFLSDSDVSWSGTRSVVVSNEGNSQFHGQSNLRVNTLWQNIDAAPYQGSRIRIAAHVRTTGGAVLLVGSASPQDFVVGNEQGGNLPGSHSFLLPQSGRGWTKLAVVADVPLDATLLYYGVSNNGATRLWLDDVSVVQVGPETPVTQSPALVGAFTIIPTNNAFLAAPTNLNFELTSESDDNAASDIPQDACFGFRLA